MAQPFGQTAEREGGGPAAEDRPHQAVLAPGPAQGVAVGQENAAELYLKPGDTIEIAYEGYATLRTHIVAP